MVGGSSNTRLHHDLAESASALAELDPPYNYIESPHELPRPYLPQHPPLRRAAVVLKCGVGLGDRAGPIGRRPALASDPSAARCPISGRGRDVIFLFAAGR
jgi:hypothetical protein